MHHLSQPKNGLTHITQALMKKDTKESGTSLAITMGYVMIRNVLVLKTNIFVENYAIAASHARRDSQDALVLEGATKIFALVSRIIESATLISV
jgi:hypothetical protein